MCEEGKPCQGHHSHEAGESGACCAPLGGVRRIVQPWLLLFLVEEPSHGYELMDRLAREQAAPNADAALLYRTLRNLEEAGLVRSQWDTEGRGAARRLYEVTPAGVEHLRAWADHVQQMRERLARFLEAYDELGARLGGWSTVTAGAPLTVEEA